MWHTLHSNDFLNSAVDHRDSGMSRSLDNRRSKGRTPTNFLRQQWQKGDSVLVKSTKVCGSGVVQGFSLTGLELRVKMDLLDSKKKYDFTVKPSECQPVTESPTRRGGDSARSLTHTLSLDADDDWLTRSSQSRGHTNHGFTDRSATKSSHSSLAGRETSIVSEKWKIGDAVYMPGKNRYGTVIAAGSSGDWLQVEHESFDHKSIGDISTVHPEKCEPDTRYNDPVDSIHKAVAEKFQKDSHHQDDHQQRSSEPDQRLNTARKPSIGEDNRKREQNSRTSESRQPNEGSLTASSAQQQPHRWKEGDPVFVPCHDRHGIVLSVTGRNIEVKLAKPIINGVSIIQVKQRECQPITQDSQSGKQSEMKQPSDSSEQIMQVFRNSCHRDHEQVYSAAINNPLRLDGKVPSKTANKIPMRSPDRGTNNMLDFRVGDTVYVRKHRYYGEIREIYYEPYSENGHSGKGYDAMSMEDYKVKVETEQGLAFVRLSDCSLQIKGNAWNEKVGDAKAKPAATGSQDLSSRRDRLTDTEGKHSIKSYGESEKGNYLPNTQSSSNRKNSLTGLSDRAADTERVHSKINHREQGQPKPVSDNASRASPGSEKRDGAKFKVDDQVLVGSSRRPGRIIYIERGDASGNKVQDYATIAFSDGDSDETRPINLSTCVLVGENTVQDISNREHFVSCRQSDDKASSIYAQDQKGVSDDDKSVSDLPSLISESGKRKEKDNQSKLHTPSKKFVDIGVPVQGLEKGVRVALIYKERSRVGKIMCIGVWIDIAKANRDKTWEELDYSVYLELESPKEYTTVKLGQCEIYNKGLNFKPDHYSDSRSHNDHHRLTPNQPKLSKNNTAQASATYTKERNVPQFVILDEEIEGFRKGDRVWLKNQRKFGLVTAAGVVDNGKILEIELDHEYPEKIVYEEPKFCVRSDNRTNSPDQLTTNGLSPNSKSMYDAMSNNPSPAAKVRNMGVINKKQDIILDEFPSHRTTVRGNWKDAQSRNNTGLQTSESTGPWCKSCGKRHEISQDPARLSSEQAADFPYGIPQECENCSNFMLFATVREKADKTYFSEITPVSLCGFDEYQKYGDELETSIREYISPPTDLRQYGGFWKGVQGDQNSCYMDASVFAMFSYLTVFDEIVKERQPSEDTVNSKKIRQILRETIVSPLRKYGFVQKDSMHAFRQLLDELGLVKGLKGEEKDPEEFLNLLLANVFATPPPITLSNKQSSHLFHLLADKGEGMDFPTVQELVERTCFQEALKIVKIPPYLILHLPRFGKDFKMYDSIMPSLELDITDVLNETRRKCFLCGGKTATQECYGCFQDSNDIVEASFCEECFGFYHRNPKREHHQPHVLDDIDVAQGTEGASSGVRCVLRLAAVLCIETSHYVTFVATDTTRRAQWLFFDSMSDRKGTTNIPEVRKVEDLTQHLKEARENFAEDPKLLKSPPLVRRLLRDPYICFYINPDAAQYAISGTPGLGTSV